MKNKCPKLSIFYDHIVSAHEQMNIPLKEAALRIHNKGIDYVDLNSSYIYNAKAEVAEVLEFASLKIGCICHECDFGRDSDISNTKALIDLASSLAVGKILIIPGLISCEEKCEQEIEQMIRCVRLLSEYADKKGIVICLEVYDNAKSPLSGRGILKFFKKCVLVRCAFDTGNFAFWDEEEVYFYEQMKDKIVHVHLKDRGIVKFGEEHPVTAVNGKQYYPSPVGYGVMKIEEIVKLLKKDSYEGMYAIEHYGAADQMDYIEKSICWINNRKWG